MQTRQWMVTHEWMVNGNRQTEWIDRRGILLWLAEYAGGVGAGLYLVSLFFNDLWGMLAGLLIVAGLKGTFHIIYLGKPFRVWRMIMHPQSSWISRGLMFVILFFGFALLQMLFSMLLSDQTAAIMVLKIMSGIFAFCVATYTGFVMNYVKSIPFWNLPLLPLLFVTGGILGGFGLTVAIGLFVPAVNLGWAEIGSRILLILDALLVATYLILAFQKETAGKKSVLYQITGGLSPIFWTCVVAMGMIIPAVIAVYSMFAAAAVSILLISGVICEVIGHVMLKYCVLKAGIYNPIVPGRSAQKPALMRSVSFPTSQYSLADKLHGISYRSDSPGRSAK